MRGCGLCSDEDATIAQEKVKELRGQVIGGIIYMNSEVTKTQDQLEKTLLFG